MCGTETLKDVNLVIVHTNIKVNDLGKSEKQSALQEKVRGGQEEKGGGKEEGRGGKDADVKKRLHNFL